MRKKKYCAISPTTPKISRFFPVLFIKWSWDFMNLKKFYLRNSTLEFTMKKFKFRNTQHFSFFHDVTNYVKEISSHRVTYKNSFQFWVSLRLNLIFWYRFQIHILLIGPTILFAFSKTNPMVVATSKVSFANVTSRNKSTCLMFSEQFYFTFQILRNRSHLVPDLGSFSPTILENILGLVV